MIAEVQQAKRFLGAKFGYGEHIPEGVYAVPTETSKGNAFMRVALKNENDRMSDFKLFWDEALTISWYSNPKPNEDLPESEFSKAFRNLESCR